MPVMQDYPVESKEPTSKTDLNRDSKNINNTYTILGSGTDVITEGQDYPRNSDDSV